MIKNSEINIRKISLLKPKNIIFVSAALVIIIIASTIYEYSANKNEIYHLLNEYSNSILNVVTKSSENSIFSDSEMENLLAQHLLGVARNVARLDSLNLLNNDLLVQIGDENEVFRINVFNKNKERVFSNAGSDSIHQSMKGKYSPDTYLTPLYDGSETEIIIGLKEARIEKGNRFAVGVTRAFGKGVIVVNLDAESYLKFKNKIGFGKLILDMGSGAGIEYILLQNTNEILAANKNVDELSSFSNDEELKYVFDTENSIARIVQFEGRSVYEAVNLFKMDNNKIGIFRVGLSMDEIYSSESRMLTRAVVVSLIVIVMTIIILSVIISNQNYNLISEEYKRIQTLTGNIIENLSPALITTDSTGNIIIFNNSAYKLLSITDDVCPSLDTINEISHDLSVILNKREKLENFEIETSVNGIRRTFMLNSASTLETKTSNSTYSLLIEDITDTRKIEKQLSQNEKFTAMGELASGVAHEIRNPLNTIIMISQRLEREYKYKINSEDFSSLLEILRSESYRVNSIVEQFLRFTKPAKLMIAEYDVNEFLTEIIKIAEVQTINKTIKIQAKINEYKKISFDYQQMKQVFINLIRNAIDASQNNGEINIEFTSSNKGNVFTICDNGSGITKENIKKIFDIYFTTKKNGTGMGLSIVRQIVLQHNGTIEVESEINRGSKFIITIP
ncbi:MAG: ATP-binding protein [Ignavibacteria bacterium]